MRAYNCHGEGPTVQVSGGCPKLYHRKQNTVPTIRNPTYTAIQVSITPKTIYITVAICGLVVGLFSGAAYRKYGAR